MDPTPSFDPWIASRVLLTLGGALLVYTLVKRALRLLAEGGHVPEGMILRLRSSLRWLLIVVVLTVVLQTTHVFDQAWAVLSAVLLTVAVGFVALWSVLSNAVCAVLILVFRPFRMGDHIEILEPTDQKNGFRGKVTDLSLMFTTIEERKDDASLVLCRVPNSVFFLKGVRVTVPQGSPPSTSFFPR